MGIQEPFRVRNGLEVATDALIVKSTNKNVGIGTFTPQYNVDVIGDINYTGTLYNNGIGVQFGGPGSGESYWSKTSSGIITTSNVGINTTKPTSKLHIIGNALITGIVTATKFVGDGSGLTNLQIGIVTYAQAADTATYATSSGIATVSQGLTGSPNITVGIVTATRFVGSGSSLTDIPTSYWVKNNIGIHTVSNIGIGTTSPTSNLTVVGDVIISGSGIVTATKYYGDGTSLVGAAAVWYCGDNNLLSCNTSFPNITSGWGNLALGYQAGQCLTTGEHNVLLGYGPGKSITSGQDNIFVGRNAGANTTSGTRNNFFGFYAGFRNVTGVYNNYFGPGAGRGSIGSPGGVNNNFLGVSAGQCITSGQSNNFFGPNAGRYNTSGSWNNFFGDLSGNATTTGCDNNFFGQRSGAHNVDGCHNIFIGTYAGCCQTSGNNNIAIGRKTELPNPTGSDQLIIGNLTNAWIYGNSSYNVGIGTSTPTSKLQIVGDVKVGIDTSQGVILTAPNGTSYRIIVNNSGTLSTTVV
jgi:hypothetical protein